MNKPLPLQNAAFDAVAALRASGFSVARKTTVSRPAITYLEMPSDGQDARLPLLLLHGVGSSADTWRRLIPHLDPRAIIAPDYRGHGHAECPETPYHLDDFVDDIIRVLDETRTDLVHVAGFSIGALFAEKLALVQPERVKTLVLLNSIAERTEEQKLRAQERLAFLASHTPPETAPATARRWFTPGFLDTNGDLVDAEAGITVVTPHDPYVSAYRVLVENDLIDEVSAIDCPTLIMTGELDVGSTPAMSEALHRRIPGSQLQILDGVKHYMHYERPQEVARSINEFLETTEVEPESR